MRLRSTIFVWLTLSFAFVLSARTAVADVSFVRNIAPIILKRCTGCHGERINLGGYRAHTYQGLMKQGGSRAASIAPGKPDESKLFKLITSKSAETRMPKSDDPLSTGQIDLIRKWIQEGAKYDGGDPTTPLKSLGGPHQHPAAPASYRTPAPVMALAFGPGGKELFVGGYNEVTVWNPATGALIRRLQHLPQRIQALSFSRDGNSLLVAGGTPGEYGEVDLVDPTSGERLTVLDTSTDIMLTAAFSADGTQIAAGGADMSVRAYEAATGKRLWISAIHSDWVTGVSFSFDGKLVASASRDMTVKLHDGETGALFTTYNGHNRQIGKYQCQDAVYAVQFFPDSLQACSVGGGKWIQIWDPIKTKAEAGSAADMEERFAKESSTRYIEHGFGSSVFALEVRDGQVFAGSADGRVKQFDLTTMKEVKAFTGATDWIYSIDYDSASKRIAAGSYNGEVRVWDVQTGQSVSTFKSQPHDSIKQTSVSPVNSAHR